jgi:BirA family biotin operon repressor/biotin-[acetyl-CoA-carboxylase] ligase
MVNSARRARILVLRDGHFPSMSDRPPATVPFQDAFRAPLAPAEVRRALSAQGRDDVDVQCVDRTGSTNTDLLAQARDAAPAAPVLRAALEQSAGRGRHGRRWVTARGSALMFSLARAVARSSEAADRMPAAVTLACGIAVAETLRARGVDARLKWPNDVLLDDGKLAGILTELAVDGAGRRTLVVGVGVNLWFDEATRAALRAVRGLRAVSLDACVALERLAREREHWIGTFAAAMLETMDRFEQAGFAALQARYDALLAFAGADVQLTERQSRIAQGRLLGVDAMGQLRLQTPAGVRTFVAGEVSLRRLPEVRP